MYAWLQEALDSILSLESTVRSLCFSKVQNMLLFTGTCGIYYTCFVSREALKTKAISSKFLVACRRLCSNRNVIDAWFCLGYYFCYCFFFFFFFFLRGKKRGGGGVESIVKTCKIITRNADAKYTPQFPLIIIRPLINLNRTSNSLEPEDS